MVILDEFVFGGIGRIGTVLAVLRRGGKATFLVTIFLTPRVDDIITFFGGESVKGDTGTFLYDERAGCRWALLRGEL